MATIVLSAAGMAAGSALGGSVLGLSSAVIGRAAGAALGRIIDQRLLGSGSDPVEVGKLERFRLNGASEGMAVARVYGRMRVAGQVIWATQFVETATTTGGGKGQPVQPQVTEYSYSVSLALALCEGTITRVGRIWADGEEIAPFDLNMRVYTGTDDQLPDPKISATEGPDHVPAYRGIAYVVIEDLPLGQFGNRVPQLTFEIMRPSAEDAAPEVADMARQIRGVALIPGTGEYALDTEPAYLGEVEGDQVAINVNAPSGATDYVTAITALTGELPACGSACVVVSWFGSDLRCAECDVQPKVEQAEIDAPDSPWQVAGAVRSTAGTVPQDNGRPVYGGTPSDQSVIRALRNMAAKGLRPVFYPFILMEQMAGNTLPDPWTGQTGQKPLPWRGRITLDRAPGQADTTDRTEAAEAEVAAFMGTAQLSDFTRDGEVLTYSGPSEWRYRRFILHYAHICAIAGGVSAFCIGSEMRALTQIRGVGDSFPAVAALRQLAAECSVILGPDCKISYAADWSEYHGYQPAGTADKYFHLDPLWADPNVDFIGIDNYMPLSDWRDGDDHADAVAGSIYNLDYLTGNVAGGEGYDWYYHSDDARAAQIRTPITDGNGEPWVWRNKDLHGWWAHRHHDRIGGVRQAQPTAWQPQSKPFWFTEFGCAAIDRGTNQPNKFLDPKSSESLLPRYSGGMRDDFMQMQYVRAVYRHFGDPSRNPMSDEYAGRMLDISRTHVWAWDTRPFPVFPGKTALWSDGPNYHRGHWLNGRASARTLAGVVAEICEGAGITSYDVSRLYGVVRGYVVTDLATARSALQPLMLVHGIEAVEREGQLVFFNRTGRKDVALDLPTLADHPETGTPLELTRAPDSEIAGRVQIGYLDAEADYEAAMAETVHASDRTVGVARSEFAMALTRSEAARTAARWIAEACVAQDSARFALPPSMSDVATGDVVALGDGRYRIDRIEEAGLRLAEATRVTDALYLPQDRLEEGARLKPFLAPTPVYMAFMDLPLLTGDEVPHAPHVAACAAPWPGGAALYSAPQDSGYILQELFRTPDPMGVTRTVLPKGRVGLWDRQAGLRIRMTAGTLSSAATESVLSGGNTLAIGDGSEDGWEIVQFTDAVLVGPQEWEVTGLLRGQAGSDAMMPDVWPRGSRVVVMNGPPRQISLPTSARGLQRHYRFGPVKHAVTQKTFRHRVLTFKGNGYRPYAPCHLRQSQATGGLRLDWIRRARIDGDLWGQTEVPLGEEQESYLVQVRLGGAVVREVTVSEPHFDYTVTQRVADTGGTGFTLWVAQVSARFGVGPFTGLAVG